MKEITLIWTEASEGDFFPRLFISRLSEEDILNTYHIEELNTSANPFEKPKPVTIKNKIFQSSYSYIEEFDNTDYLNVTATNASGWGSGSIQLPLGGMQPIYANTNGSALDIYVSSGNAFVAAESSGLAIIDISDPTNLGQPIYMDTNGSAQGVFVSGDYAFIADRYSGLAIIDISDPTTPSQPIYKNLSDDAWDVFVYHGYAFVTIGDPNIFQIPFPSSNLAIIDISTPLTPGEPIYREINGSVQDIHVSGDFAYIACGFQGLAIINISDPYIPGQPIYMKTRRPARGVYVSDDYALVSMDDPWIFGNESTSLFGLAFINISDPTSPGQPIYQNTSTDAWGVHISGNHAFVASGSDGLAFIDINNPLIPSYPIYSDTEGFAENVYISDDYAFVAAKSAGLAIIKLVQVSPAIVQTKSLYTGEGFVHNFTLYANQTILPNTSIDHQISSNGNAWIPITLNDTYSFETNPYHGLYWRAVLEAEDQQEYSPRIDSFRIDFDVYIDEDPPIVHLISPQNNTAITPGTTIELLVTDFTLDKCGFIWSGDVAIYGLTEPWTIVAATTEGYHWLLVQASDSAGHNTLRKFLFIVNRYPRIKVSSPLNGSIVPQGTIIHVNFTDGTGLHWIWYNWNDQSNITVNNLDYWGSLVFDSYLGGVPESEGFHSLIIYVNDTYGLVNSIYLQLYVDVTPPSVILSSSQNNSAISPSSAIEFSIRDYLLNHCWFSWDNGINLTLIAPWTIIAPTSEGYHWLTIHTNDSIGHLTTRCYQFYVNYSPLIELQSSLNNSIIIPLTEIKFLIMDPTLTSVWYQWDSFGNNSLISPFIVKAINSSGFHILTIGARDSWNNITIKTYSFYILGSISVEITRNPPSIVYSGESFVYSFTIINTEPIPLNLLLIVIGSEDDVLTGNGSQIGLNSGENTTIGLEIRPKHASTHQLEIYLLYEGLVYYYEILQFNVAPQWMSPTFLFQVLLMIIFLLFMVIISGTSFYYVRKQFELRRLLWEQHDQLTRLIDQLTISNLEANITREAEATGSEESSIRPFGFPQYLHLSEPVDREALRQKFYSIRNQIENGDPNNLQELSELLTQAEELLEELQEELE